MHGHVLDTDVAQTDLPIGLVRAGTVGRSRLVWDPDDEGR